MPILRAGFTSVSVPGGKWFVDVTLRDSVNTGMLQGPRIFCAPPIKSSGVSAASIEASRSFASDPLASDAGVT
jgi:hypothetical protein